MDAHRGVDTGRRVGAGLPAKGPGLLANFHRPFTVDAATVFAGEPAPTPDWWWTHIGGWTQAVVGAGLPAKGPGLLANFHRPFTVAATTVFAGKPAPTPDWWWTHIGGGHRPSCRSGFTRERAGPAGQSPPAVHR
ncbi:hypothetical protein F7661_13550 [Pseudomonas sp. CFA]|nr:hypothetical protein F7661_13550 [Pseudomonas sp. CFA]